MKVPAKPSPWEEFLDFNSPTDRARKARRKSGVVPAHVQKAATQITKRKGAAVEFLQELDRAATLLYGSNKERSDANQVALKAVVALLDATGQNETRRFSKIFELLADNLKNRMPARSHIGGQGGGAGGVDRDSRSHNVKAATAYLIEFLSSLPGEKRKVRQRCWSAADVLTQREFQFSGKNAAIAKEYAEEVNALKFSSAVSAPRPGAIKEWKRVVTARSKAIEMWRRGFKAGGGGRAGDLFRRYRNRKPFKVTDDAGVNTQSAIAWWYEQLLENDY